MKLLLHTPDEKCRLSESYGRAFTSATELLIVSAYLTSWSKAVPLNAACKRFRMVVGKDFGITRKAACMDVLAWLPRDQKVNFRIADQIMGFHPKAVFWREADGNAYAIIGSSNLSLAAFGDNYEANLEVPITAEQYDQAEQWVEGIAQLSVPVSKDWLANYHETQWPRGGGSRSTAVAPIFPIKLPWPKGSAAAIRNRRTVLADHRKNRRNLLALFRACARGRKTSAQFYDELPRHWGGQAGGRLQGKGWERSGRESDFEELAKSFVAILDARPSQRDDIVVKEIDRLAEAGVPTRRAFLSEMLCLTFPDLYPVLNKPVRRYLSDVKFRGAAGSSEGAGYVDLALRLRLSLAQNPKHPAKNIAELDTVIWLAYADA
jgi:HKD family nuclease